MARDVATKVLAGTNVDQADRAHFEQEARAAAPNHPNILAIYDVCTHDCLLYIVKGLAVDPLQKDRLPV